MKLKFICLLAAFTAIHVTASPKRYCNGLGCPKQKVVAVQAPAAPVVAADETELLPNHYFLNHI